MNKVYYSDELTHWGIKGQKWGIRRFQNEDGTLTEEGKKRYGNSRIGIYDTTSENISGSIARQKTAIRRINAAEKAVKTYGGVNAAKAEVDTDYKKAQIKNILKYVGTSTLTGGTATAGVAIATSFWAWREPIRQLLGLTIAGGGLAGLAVTTVGAIAANYLLETNKKLSVNYINDVGNRKGVTKNVVNSFSK